MSVTQYFYFHFKVSICVTTYCKNIWMELNMFLQAWVRRDKLQAWCKVVTSLWATGNTTRWSLFVKSPGLHERGCISVLEACFAPNTTTNMQILSHTQYDHLSLTFIWFWWRYSRHDKHWSSRFVCQLSLSSMKNTSVWTWCRQQLGLYFGFPVHL